MATTDIYTIQGSTKPTMEGCRFLGGNVDDQIQINAAGLAMANVSTKGTLAAWIMVPDDTGTYTILSFGDDDVVEYITLDVVAGTLRAICCDNTTVQWSYVTTNVVIFPHTWHHVAVVQDGTQPKLYVDGKEVTAITRTTETLPSAWFKACAGIDAGSIGAFEGNGDTSLTQEFKGYISRVAIWAGTVAAVALDAEEIRRAMNNPEGVEATYLHNYWKLDGNVVDAGTGADNGTIVGDIIYSDGNEFFSKFSFGCGTAVVADKVIIGCGDNYAIGIVIQAA